MIFARKIKRINGAKLDPIYTDLVGSLRWLLTMLTEDQKENIDKDLKVISSSSHLMLRTLRRRSNPPVLVD